MPVDLVNIGEITPAASPLTVNGSMDLVGTAPAPQYLINGVPIGTSAFVDPTTTRGDLIVRGAAAPSTRLGIGTNGQVLVADSAQTLGLHWVTKDAANINLNPPGSTWITIQDAVMGLEADSPGTLLTAQGDLLTRSATALARLARGTDGQVLEAESTAPNGIHWVTPSTPASILTTLGDLIVRGAAAPARLGVGTNGQTLLADSTQTNGLHWATMTANLVNLNPAPTGTTWTTVQNAVDGMHSSIVALSRGMSYVGHYDASTNQATFVPAMSSLSGNLPPANSPGIDEGDFLVVTAAGAGPPAANVGDQLISGGPSGGAAWILLPIGHSLASVTAATVPLAPVLGSWTTVQVALADINTTFLHNPLTTLGDIVVRGATVPVRLGVGTNGQVLTANSAATNGLEWAAPAVTGAAGSQGNIQFNAGGSPAALGASGDLNWSPGELEVKGDLYVETIYLQRTPASDYMVFQIRNGGFSEISAATAGNAPAPLILDGSYVGIGSFTTGAPPQYKLDVKGSLNITGDFSINGIVFAEAGSVNLAATSITGIDGEPLKLIASNGAETDLDALLERLARLEALLAQ